MSSDSTIPGMLKEQSHLEEGLEFSPRFDAMGLIPAVVQELGSNEIIMLAYMNREALALTMDKKEAVFYSRSRKQLWHKGKESGNILKVHEIRYDCDQDALLLRVDIAGKAQGCHTGRKSCFYRSVQGGSRGDRGQFVNDLQR